MTSAISYVANANVYKFIVYFAHACMNNLTYMLDHIITQYFSFKRESVTEFSVLQWRSLGPGPPSALKEERKKRKRRKRKKIDINYFYSTAAI